MKENDEKRSDDMPEQQSAGRMSRRQFLGGAAAAGAVAAVGGLFGCSPKSSDQAGSSSTSSTGSASGDGSMQTLDPSKAVWPVVEEFEPAAAGDGNIAFVAEAIADSDIVEEHDVDVVVCGLGPSGDAAALRCAENGLKTVAVEKQPKGNYNPPPSAAPRPRSTSIGA